MWKNSEKEFCFPQNKKNKNKKKNYTYLIGITVTIKQTNPKYWIELVALYWNTGNHLTVRKQMIDIKYDY